jgi:hypothetical protein
MRGYRTTGANSVRSIVPSGKTEVPLIGIISEQYSFPCNFRARDVEKKRRENDAVCGAWKGQLGLIGIMIG